MKLQVAYGVVFEFGIAAFQMGYNQASSVVANHQ
jgi:hypothetical protein